MCLCVCLRVFCQSMFLLCATHATKYQAIFSIKMPESPNFKSTVREKVCVPIDERQAVQGDGLSGQEQLGTKFTSWG